MVRVAFAEDNYAWLYCFDYFCNRFSEAERMPGSAEL